MNAREYVLSKVPTAVIVPRIAFAMIGKSRVYYEVIISENSPWYIDNGATEASAWKNSKIKLEAKSEEEIKEINEMVNQSLTH